MNKKTIVKKLVLKRKIKIFISKSLLSIIIVLVALILMKKDPKYLNNIKENVYEKSFKFGVLKNYYNKYFGKIIPLNNLGVKDEAVFNEKLSYKNSNVYKDGVCLTVSDNYLVPSLGDGVVIFIGDMDDYGKTIVVEQSDGVEVFYGNLDNINLKLYDYVKKGSLIGGVKEDKLYLVFFKDGKYLDYKEFI